MVIARILEKFLIILIDFRTHTSIKKNEEIIDQAEKLTWIQNI